MENKLQFSLRMKDIQLIWEKDEKYGKTHKRLVKLIAISWQYQIKENKLLCTRKLQKMIT